MATRPTGLKDLGRLEPLNERRLDAEVILWGRFGVIGARREVGSGFVIAVEDLDRSLGEPPAHHLELHVFEHLADRERLERACMVLSRIQPVAYALGEAGHRMVLACATATGVPIERLLAGTGDEESGQPAGLDRSRLLSLGTALAELLTQLHEANVHGVTFNAAQLRVADNQFSLAGFTHVFGPARAPERDVESLMELLTELGGKDSQPLLATPLPATASELWAQLSAARSAQDDFQLPPEPPFVGRYAAMAALEAGISQAQIAKPTAIVVQGERGVGKSRLLREFGTKHQSSSELLVLTGVWQDQSGDTRSGLLGALEQLSRILPRLDPDERDDIRRRINRATGNLGAIVARSAPALGSVLRHAEELPQLELGGEFSRHTAVIADVLKSLGTRQRPLLLVLDNVENIDANSAAVLDIITQVRPAHYTFVVMGLRTDRDTSPALQFQHDTLDLKPLNQDEIAEFLRRQLPGDILDLDDVARVLLRESSGLPLSLSTIARTWIERARLLRKDGVWRLIATTDDGHRTTPSLRDIVAARVAQFDDEIKNFALLMAVLGLEIRREQVVELSSTPEKPLAELRQRGMLAETDSSYRFPHDTIREFLLDAFSAADRRRAHRRAAEILAKRGATIAQIVYHRDRGFDDASATPEEFDKLSRLHVEAGRDRLDVYDLERARWHLERALEHSHDPDQRSLAAEGLADICLLQEDLDAAVSLYTAIIATSSAQVAVRVAAKAVQFLFSKSANADAKMLGLMALEMAKEPTPTSAPGKLWVLLTSLIKSWMGECKLDPALREALCRLYMYMLYIGLIDDPVSVPMYAARAHWIAYGLRAGAAAISRSLEGALVAVLGFVKYADATFAWSNEVAQESKDAWAQGMVFHHWGGALLGIDRYSEGQDRLDDAIAAFRETGDVSIALVAIFYKGLYGRDRESANVVLGWIDEALNTARRNGKRSGVPPLQTLRMHVIARQGQTDIRDRLIHHAHILANEEMPGIERMVSHIQLAYAGLESMHLDLAEQQVAAAERYADEMGGTVPEFCQEVHLVAALFRLARPLTTRAEKATLRRSVRKFRNAAKRAPRLQVLREMLDMKYALFEGRHEKARFHASRIVTEFETHENLHATRQAHRALARMLKGENVLAAAEHERLARNFGRRLGFADHVLLSDFSELGREVSLLTLAEISDSRLHETHDDLPSAGMLSASPDSSPAGRERAQEEEENDILEVWNLVDVALPAVNLNSLISPVRSAVANVIPDNQLTIDCKDPDLQITVNSADLQLVIINMLLACADAVGTDISADLKFTDIIVDDLSQTEHDRLPQRGQYLVINLIARGAGVQVPIVGSFSTCSELVESLNGVLSASTDRSRVELTAYIPLSTLPTLPPLRQIIIVHPDAEVRETVGDLVAQTNRLSLSFHPSEVIESDFENASVVMVDGGSLGQLDIPAGIRTIELVGQGRTPTGSSEHLQIPVDLAELEQLLGADR